MQILQGEEGWPSAQCDKIGEITLDDLPPKESLPPRIVVRYRIDKNGMCTAHAEDLISGKEAELQFDYSKGVSRAAAS